MVGDLVEGLGDTALAKRHFHQAIETVTAAESSHLSRAREAQARARLGHSLRREGDLDAAERELRSAESLLRACQLESELPQVLYELGVIALFRLRHADSAKAFDEGQAIARRLGARQAEATIASGRGLLLAEQGLLEEALASHATAVRLFADIGSRHRQASALYYRGTTLCEMGSLDEAFQALTQAMNAMPKGAMPRYEALIGSALAAVLSRQGRSDDAVRSLKQAERAAHLCATEVAIAACVAIHRLHIDVAFGSPLASCIQAARAIASRTNNDDVRFALRFLLASETSLPNRDALIVQKDGNGFFLPGKTVPIDLSRRLPLRRILVALAELHEDATGEALSLDELVRAGWPGERVGAASAANRVRVALATLRKLGLKDAIKTGRGGYLLDPALRVQIATRKN